MSLHRSVGQNLRATSVPWKACKKTDTPGSVDEAIGRCHSWVSGHRSADRVEASSVTEVRQVWVHPNALYSMLEAQSQWEHVL